MNASRWKNCLKGMMIDGSWIEEPIRVKEAVRFHFLRDQVNKGKIDLKHCKKDLQLAYIMIGALKIDRFKMLRKMMCVVNSTDF